MSVAFSEKTYLLIDDFADMRSAIRSILHSLGANRVDQARDGADAIAQMERKRYDVVLCDYNLGDGKNGQQILEEARYRQLIGVDTIFIMITAEHTREMVMGAVEYAPDNYLAKPFTKELLQTRLSKLLDSKANLVKVNKALMVKDYAAALKELSTLIEAKPKNLADLLKLKSDVCLLANRYDEAMTIFEQVLAVREVPWARLGMGKVLFWRKNYTQAREVFEQLIALDHNLIAAHDWLAKTQMAMQDFGDATQTLQTATKLSPRGLKRQQLLGELALTTGDHQAAEAAFERAVSLAKHSVLNHPSLFAGLAKSKSANNKHGEALRVAGEISKVFANSPDAALYKATTTAIVKQNQGDLQGAAEAMQAAEIALADLGETTDAHKLALEMAKTFAHLGEQDKASTLLAKAIANNHDDEEMLLEIVQVCRETGLDYDAETAIREVKQGVIRTNNEGVRLIKQGDFDGALHLLNEAAEEMPGNKTINLNAAKAIIMKMEATGANDPDLQRVRRLVERVQRLAPGDWRLSDILSRLRKLSP
jgi:tetratricopeptide (TPR) repeat protein